MALTVGTPVKAGVFGDLKYVLVDITWDNAYATGGIALTPNQVGLSVIYAVLPSGNAYDAQGAVIPAYSTSTSKLVALGADGAAAGVTFLKEVANAADLSTITSSLLFIGK